MFAFYPYIHRGAVIRNMAARHNYDSEVQRLLHHLNAKELQILQKNLDLVDRVSEVSKLDAKDLREILVIDYDLEVEAHTGSIWISCTDIAKRVPENLANSHVGWWFEGEPEFVAWARDFLMQDIRINIMLRYIEHKREEAKSSGPLQYGMYL